MKYRLEIAATARLNLRSDLVVAPARGGVAISLLAAAGPRLIAVPTVTGQAADHTAIPRPGMVRRCRSS